MRKKNLCISPAQFRWSRAGFQSNINMELTETERRCVTIKSTNAFKVKTVKAEFSLYLLRYRRCESKVQYT